MAYLTDDKRNLILKCKNCGGEVSYSTNYPFTGKAREDQLETVLSVWQEKAETCDACLFGPTVGASDDVKPQPETGGTAVPQSPKGDKADEGPQESPSPEGPLTLKDHTPPRMYDAKECQALLRISHGRALKFIREEIIPLGGCVRVGNRYLVHAWALNHALSLRTIQTRPRRPYSPVRMARLKASRSKSKNSLPISSEMPSLPSGEKS